MKTMQPPREARARHVIAALAAAIVLAACGGDPAGGGDEDPGIPTQTADEFSAYIGGLAVDDTAEPMDLGSTQPPTSETVEPIDVS